MGRLLDIATRERTRVPMQRHAKIEVTVEAGLDGDFRGKTPERNVTVISREGWQAACRELGDTLPWTTRRANLLVEGVELAHTTGARLRVGELELEVTGECDPCHIMDKQRQGLRAALEPDWRAGVQCKVARGATIEVGDDVELRPS